MEHRSPCAHGPRMTVLQLRGGQRQTAALAFGKAHSVEGVALHLWEGTPSLPGVVTWQAFVDITVAVIVDAIARDLFGAGMHVRVAVVTITSVFRVAVIVVVIVG